VLITALALAVLAIALAWPVPLVLASASWPSRAPGTALLLWQAIAVAGGLSMIGALLCAGLAPLGDDLVRAALALPAAVAERGIGVLGPGGTIALVAAVALAVYLLAHLVRTIVLATRQRRRHRDLLALLTSPHPTRDATQVLDDAAPIAYCLPRGFGSTTVLSRGLLDTLDGDELAGVVAHERAHLDERHDVVRLAFRAWRSALPWFPIAAVADDQIARLVEYLADDRARASVDRAALARAIELVVPVIPGRPGAGGVTELGELRRARILAPERMPAASLWLVRLAAIALVAAPTVWLFTPALSRLG
jgi:Zn-dependent protease with chaperone function